MITGQATLNSSTATAILTVSDKRDMVMLCATADCYVGPSGVTASNGLLLKAGVETPVMPGDPSYASTPGTLYGITATGSAVVTWADMANQGN
jgi:hypothetical protein